jgi:hypothetical protein
MGAITEVAQTPLRIRDRVAESSAANAALVDRAMVLRESRVGGEFERTVLQIAQAFIVCCPLPYTRTKATRIERVAKMGDGSEVKVILSAVGSAEMAFGSDRVLLYWLFNKAIKLKSRFIPLRYVSEYLTDMGLTNCGKNRNDLVERLARVAGIFICVNRVDKLGKREEKMLPIFAAYRLPAAFEWRDNQEAIDFTPEEPMGIEFSETFFADLRVHRVPVPMDFIKATRKQSQLQDIINFIYYRSYIGRKTTLIPYSAFFENCWHGDTNLRRLKVRIKAAKVVLRVIWPEIDIELEMKGIRIVPHGRNRRRLVIKTGISANC